MNLMTKPTRSFLAADTLKIWTNPNSNPNIVVLYRSTLYLSAIAAKDLPKAVQMLSTGANPEMVFGNYHRSIPIIAIDRAEVDVRHNRFRFTFIAGFGSKQDEFELAGSFETDELLEILKKELGDAYQSGSIGLNPIRQFGYPLLTGGVGAVLLFIAWRLVAPSHGAMDRSIAVARLLQDNIGQQGVILTFAGLIAACVTWAAFKFIQRPSGVHFRKK